MRVVIVIDSMGGGGAERQAAILYRGLREQHSVRLVALESRNEYLGVSADDDVHFLGKASRYDTPRLVASLRRMLLDADVAICFNWYPHLLVRLADARIPRIIRYGGSLEIDVRARWRMRLAQWCQRSAAGVVGLTPGLTADACKTLGSPRLVCSSVPNAIDSSWTPHPSGAVESPWPRPYVICAARLNEDKDQATLLRAFRSICDRVPHDLVLAGTGPSEQSLKVLIAELGLTGRAHLIGFTADLPLWFECADLSVLSSRSEGFGSVLIESMAMGTPVVATDAPFGPRQILGVVRGGLLVPVGDSTRLGEAMLRMLSNDEPSVLRASALAAAARRAWGESAMVRAYSEILEVAVRGE